MNKDDLIYYLSGVLNMELNMYTEQQVLSKMTGTYNSLGRSQSFWLPKKKKGEESVVVTMFGSAVVITIVSGIVIYILCIAGIFADCGDYHVIVRILLGFILAIIYAVIIGAASFPTIGLIIGLILKAKEKHQIQEEYDQKMREYNSDIANDKKRVKRELTQKTRLGKEIALMKQRLSATRTNLSRAYSYGVINQSYQDIYAVSSFYEYLNSGRTQSLTFNPSTGDRGAYNIYEEEKRLNLIITNTQEIISRLDQVINNQHELARGLQNAQNQISNLYSGVTSFMTNTSSQLKSIENSNELIAYNQKITNSELAFLNWMNM